MPEPVTNVVPFTAPALHVCDPTTGEMLAPKDIQRHLNALNDEKNALTTALASAHRLNASLRTQVTNLKEAKAEEQCEDPELVRRLIVHHYSLFDRKRTPAKIPLSGLDAVIVRWLLDRADFTARMVAIASLGFSLNSFYRDKGMVSLMNMATTKVDGRRVKDGEKAFRFYEAGVKHRGGNA